MARIKHAKSRTNTPLDDSSTRLPLALKPSNNNMSSSASCTSESSSSITTNLDTNSKLSLISDPPALLTSSKQQNSSATTAKMKRTKSQTKAVIIGSDIAEEDSDIQDVEEAQYDLLASIHESGGIDQFLKSPCMILYKRYLSGQGKYFFFTLIVIIQVLSI